MSAATIFPSIRIATTRSRTTIPSSVTNGADEIFALGLRNPFRNGFDRGLGTLFIGDVGQNQWEEIDIGAKGANYGWRIFEGPDRYTSGTPTAGTLTKPDPQL